MGFRSKMAYRVNIIISENFSNHVRIAYICFLKDIPSGILVVDTFEIFGIPRIGKLIDVDYSARESRFSQQIADKVAPNEPTSTRNHQIVDIHISSSFLFG
jgi:hypothetical protein